MSFRVDTREVSELAAKMKTASNVLEKDLHTVSQQLDELIALESFSGAAARNAKNYFETFHKTTIESIQVITKQLSSNIHTHIDTFKEDVDSHEDARIDYNYVQEMKKYVQSVHDELEETVLNISDTLQDVSDIVAIDTPSMNELEIEKNNIVRSIDMLSNRLESFTEKGADHNDEMKEMLHHLETVIDEASTSAGEQRFTTIKSTNIVNSLSFLGDANQLLSAQQKEIKTLSAFQNIPKIAMDQVKYEQKPNFFVSTAQFLFDIVKGGTSAVYHLGEDFVN